MGAMTFNLNNVKGTAVVRLKSWGIYDVVLSGIEVAKGTTKEGKEWKAMKIKFVGDDGIFETMVFCPGENGADRPNGESNGKKWELPSALEQLQFTVAHLVTNLAPEMLEKFSKVVTGLSLPDDFEKLVEILNKVLSKSLGKKTKLKLVGDKKNYAALPNFVSINKDGDTFISNNWLGDTVAFSDYECKKMNEQKNAKPTSVKEDSEEVEAAPAGNDDLDFEV